MQLAERYTVEVRRPIDLTTVARRVRRGTYDNSAGRLRRDIARIFTNCERFNMGSGQLFVGVARHLRVRLSGAPRWGGTHVVVAFWSLDDWPV